MTDPLRTDALHRSQTPPDGERDAKIEGLLLTGLDHYFAAEYEQAIDIWTRALFLDRGHARARAYIERARSALAEQQRESEELLHKGVAALERGEIETARRLLNLAVARGGAHDAALAGLARVNRVAAAHAGSPAVSSAARHPVSHMETAGHRSRGGAISVLFLLLLFGAGVGYVLSSWEEVRASWVEVRALLADLPALPSVRQAEPLPARAPATPLTIPRSSEAAFDRATALQASGRLYDALRALELVRPTDPLRDDADKLKIEIHRQLLAHPVPASTAPTTGPTAPIP